MALDRAIREHRTEQTGRLDTRLQEFIAWHDRFPTPVAIKVAVAARGLNVGPLATPLAPGTQKRLDEFREWFAGWLPEVLKEAALV